MERLNPTPIMMEDVAEALIYGMYMFILAVTIMVTVLIVYVVVIK